MTAQEDDSDEKLSEWLFTRHRQKRRRAPYTTNSTSKEQQK